jgi:Zn-dependent peptidase ImmA (M78 family)/transcriptional regulator with XRE-family HTH domain
MRDEMNSSFGVSPRGLEAGRLEASWTKKPMEKRKLAIYILQEHGYSARMESVTRSNNCSCLPRRIIAAREDKGLSQAEMSKRLGFKDRQTLAAIEAGLRRVTPEELVAIAEIAKRDIEFFTDPFRLVGEGAFSYRASGAAAKALDSFEERVGRWLALWRHLGESRHESTSLLRPRLAINIHSTFEEAQAGGEAVGRELQLGDVPAEKLVNALESRFQLLVLEVDMPNGVSGAAVQLATGDAILINRAESYGRKAFDLAHELFHVLTWDALPPERVDRTTPTGYKQKRTEQLADNFAAALLMPERELKPRWDKLRAKASPNETLEALATHFQVSASAVGWRAVALGWLKPGEWPQDALSTSAKAKPTSRPLFSRRFVERAAWGVARGELSVRRLLDLLDISLDEFRDCCQAYGVKAEIGL